MFECSLLVFSPNGGQSFQADDSIRGDGRRQWSLGVAVAVTDAQTEQKDHMIEQRAIAIRRIAECLLMRRSIRVMRYAPFLQGIGWPHYIAALRRRLGPDHSASCQHALNLTIRRFDTFHQSSAIDMVQARL
jgi:hypothetical protein